MQEGKAKFLAKYGTENHRDRLHNHEDYLVRDLVAEHSKSPEILDKMYPDEDANTNAAILFNNHLSQNTLEKASKSPLQSIRGYVAIHPNVSPNLLHELAFDKSFAVRKRALSNPKTQDHTLNLAAERSELPGEFSEIVNHKNASKETLLKAQNNQNNNDSFNRVSVALRLFREHGLGTGE